MKDENIKYKLWLDGVKGFGAKFKLLALEYAGSAREVYGLTEKQIDEIPGFDKKHRDILKKAVLDSGIDKKYEEFIKYSMEMVTYEDCEYPYNLKNIYDPPYALYFKGKLPQKEKKSVAIVGARMCDSYGSTMALKIARCLAQSGCQIISGMAYGIDSAAHWGAVKGKGLTYAVLGCGADIVYPESNTGLYKELVSKGGVLSEYYPGTMPKPGLFPLRNRIISGLSDVVIVIQAKKRSGSLITADLAIDQGKDVYALPGDIDSELSAGTNQLIRQGAAIVTSLEDLITDLKLDNIITDEKSCKEDFCLEKEELLLYSVLDLHAKNIEDILSECGLDREKGLNILMGLLTKGYVEESFKNYYRRHTDI